MKKVTIQTLQQHKANGEKFPVLTCYDATFARLMEQVEIDVMLVGDSLGNVIQGQGSTVPVTMDEMAYHTAAVARGNSKSLLMVDMPFMSYATEEQALANAAELMQAGAHMVKLEGGAWLEETVLMLSERGIPVCAHLGLTPQSVNKLSGYKVQGRDQDGAEQMLADAHILQEAGADLLVVECIPSELGKQLSQSLEMPVIGIGAGPDTDAQVLVLHDMLGISARLPKFSHNFLADTDSIEAAIAAYKTAVENGNFPAAEHGFK
ncbi:3-methyl-2-oxobutanoate hydroxymethyltransferase [Porticoccus sp. W117]|uniref:3-methyl-2-oxobutanoate hydroxymethyltransferase n=1 Tax=Porticoccus sp. W117 TaxID=3054777 RepID=UPI0025977853|nr:3-methyl-2-oxobutanoate hydroxymethyltransferase [Porticoccus sp. W117]MDM3872414.1 3-methyl-2-oxobutanoate hydroxymethyltransferase [Porticoccus sp. W117]